MLVLVTFKMETEIIMGALGFIIGYFIFKFTNRKQGNLTNRYGLKLQSKSEQTQETTISDILNSDKYKVKGQWDK